MARVYGSAKEFRQRLLDVINQPKLSAGNIKHAGVYRLLKIVGWRGENLRATSLRGGRIRDKNEKHDTIG